MRALVLNVLNSLPADVTDIRSFALFKTHVILLICQHFYLSLSFLSLRKGLWVKRYVFQKAAVVGSNRIETVWNLYDDYISKLEKMDV